MFPIRSVSVLIPTYQGMAFLERVLAALDGQELDLPWDFVAVDSGSTDGTWECLVEWQRHTRLQTSLRRIHKVEFDHGDTRNLLASLCEGNLLVFLTQDAIPSSPLWLATLIRNFDDEQVGAAYCRNVARPDAHPLTEIFSRTDPGYATERKVTSYPDEEVLAAMNAHDLRELYNFNDVASAIRRELWSRHPFPRASFGEDMLMARALIEAGYSIVYDAEATVEHSHDYEPDEVFARHYIDGQFNAEWLDRICVVSREEQELFTEKAVAEVKGAIAALGLAAEEQQALMARARDLRGAAFRGLYEGGLSETRRLKTHVREERELHILYVVHGFPPDDWAGTEVYTFNLATEMQKRGHRCTVLTRVAPRSEDDEDFSIEESEFRGLRVLRLTHRLEHRTIRDSFKKSLADAAFRRLLAREKPDLVHFQHLIHTSIGLVEIAKEFDLPTIITCHDYWALCARVQLIRPDGNICEGNMGAGCLLCVKERGLRYVEQAKAFDDGENGIVPAFVKGVLASECAPESWKRTANTYVDLRQRESEVLEAYAAADLRISPSRFLRRKLLESGAFDPETFLYSDNGMRTDHIQAFVKRPDPRGRLRFGFVGTLVWYKGGEVLIRAMQRLRGKNAVLNVYGGFNPDSDPHHASLAALADENVVFRGRFDNAHLSEVYAEIDVLIVPSVWYENSPITIHEAFMTATPVVTAGIGGMAEYVRDGVDGLHFEVGNHKDLAAKLRRFIDEPDLLASLSRDWMRIKTIAENAAETEFRYRALVSRDVPERKTVKRVALVEFRGTDDVLREGPVDAQWEGVLLLRIGGATEYDIGGLGPAAVTIEIDVLGLGVETDVELGGIFSIDGEEVDRMPVFRAPGQNILRTHELEIELEADAQRLRIETENEQGKNGLKTNMRIKRVAVYRRARPKKKRLATKRTAEPRA